MKICFKCAMKLPLSDFYVHKGMADGHLNKCKNCAKKDIIKNRCDKIDYYREYDRDRSKNNPKRVTAHLEASKRYTRRHPERRAARGRAANMVLKGIISPEVCGCGSINTEIHHVTYEGSDENDIMWLCKICHEAWHKKYGDNNP